MVPSRPTAKQLISQKSHSELDSSAESDVTRMCRHAARSRHSSARCAPRGQAALACGMRQPEAMCASSTPDIVA